MGLTKRGDKWLARFSRQVRGAQRESARRFRLKADAERWLREQEADAESGNGYVAPSRITLDQWLDQWLAGLIDVRKRTKADCAAVADRYWRRTLGDERLDRLTTTAIRRELAKLRDAGKAPRTVQMAHSVLRQALNAAVSDGKLRVNPAIGERMVPAQVRAERTVWNRAQVRAFLTQRAEDPLVALWTVQLFTGLRPSEALALKWSDVDLTPAAPAVRIRRTIYRPKRGGGWTLEGTKTDKHRTVPLVPQAVAALTAHRDRQAVERLVAAERYAGYDFVFAVPRGQPLRADLMSKQWRRAIADLNAETWRQAEAAGTQPAVLPPMRLYDARHTCATLLLEAGEHLKVVQEVLGHSTIALTADLYSHVRPEMAHQAMARLGAFVDGTDKTRTTEQ